MFKDNKQKLIICIILLILNTLLTHYYINNSFNSNNNSDSLKLAFSVIIVIVLVIYIVRIRKSENFYNKNERFKLDKINNKYNDLINYIGNPTYKETDKHNMLNSATWMIPLDAYTGKTIKGLDYIKINGFLGRKYHPIPADMFVIAGKYLYVPPELIGPLKLASHTINIEQLMVPRKLNNNFGKDNNHGKKGQSLVTGSCASVTISSITVKFVEDILHEYKKSSNKKEFIRTVKLKDIYNDYLLNYLCKNQAPNIMWFNPEDFGEDNIMSSIEQCNETYNKKKKKAS